MSAIARYVVDASVGAKWVAPEPDSAQARTILDAAASGAAQLLAPDIYVAEVANVLWKRCRLRGELTEEEAAEGLRLLLNALPELVPAATLTEQALALAISFRFPVYDCLYVALALQEACPLVTDDRRLARAFGPATGHIITLDAV